MEPVYPVPFPIQTSSFFVHVGRYNREKINDLLAVCKCSRFCVYFHAVAVRHTLCTIELMAKLGFLAPTTKKDLINSLVPILMKIVLLFAVLLCFNSFVTETLRN